MSKFNLNKVLDKIKNSYHNEINMLNQKFTNYKNNYNREYYGKIFFDDELEIVFSTNKKIIKNPELVDFSIKGNLYDLIEKYKAMNIINDIYLLDNNKVEILFSNYKIKVINLL